MKIADSSLGGLHELTLTETQKAHTGTKFILPSEMINFVISRNGNFLRCLSQKFSVKISIDDGSSLPHVKKSEEMIEIKGRLIDVQNATVFILRRAYEFTMLRKDNYTEMIKMLIPTNYVSKLIGAKGTMVRELAKKSMGAQIKIMSDRELEKTHDE